MVQIQSTCSSVHRRGSLLSEEMVRVTRFLMSRAGEWEAHTQNVKQRYSIDPDDDTSFHFEEVFLLMPSVCRKLSIIQHLRILGSSTIPHLLGQNV